MTSSVISDNFETSTGAIPTLGGDSVETRLCRAWVNFNGTGTVAIRASYNVSSITDNSTGSYTVNFTTAMADVNYCATLSYTNEVNVQHAIGFLSTLNAGFVQVEHFDAANSAHAADKAVVNIAIFR